MNAPSQNANDLFLDDPDEALRRLESLYPKAAELVKQSIHIGLTQSTWLQGNWELSPPRSNDPGVQADAAGSRKPEEKNSSANLPEVWVKGFAAEGRMDGWMELSTEK